ncbi:hypothetical protein [Leptospira kirschneri]|uniref:Uncharacterized protein n=1 Tax=Leptospira kirschneri serovar Bulgarica str. Nikolaevo TaxID=1240687 RepID=M6FHV1_9LEPT|nr:hypothetical protein [Leptospira kirschneri]EMK22371.1 hypothetical protein LEP1GSC008_1561 [Leptospira kirschneri serovar Bulgarica str. Nikolaevo]EMK24502.1 hypothetical protein LEP1GSC008_2634 [Leptospira kirschneri serovar Bulgarica str. Nikolaevo]EMK24854.1 hypothetical protein LEP1GSC008_0596 [Leptospira kirschneri serovar Bulgarica str. Nikolaevo]
MAIAKKKKVAKKKVATKKTGKKKVRNQVPPAKAIPSSASGVAVDMTPENSEPNE